MEKALVLTQELADAAGRAGAGPFFFGGVFPGVWVIDQPVELSELGFASEDEALAALEASGLKLELVHVEKGSAPALRENHDAGELEATRLHVDEVVEEKAGGYIGSHKEADAVAAELGITFAEGEKLEAKREAIAELRAGGLDGTPDTAGDQDGGEV